MKIFIWEGNKISSAYHNDGTLVVLANTVEEARETVRKNKKLFEEETERLRPEREEWYKKENQLVRENGGYSKEFWNTKLGKDILKEREKYVVKGRYLYPDGKDEALDREPDEILEVNQPIVVSFNGGGYD